jgi:ABC-type nitrate/sulfonate/bicarbonate transport system permease component
MRRLWRGAILPVFILAAWEFSSRFGWMTYESLSYPSAIASAGWTALLDGSILLATWQTVQSALFGLLLGGVIGVLLGAILGLSAMFARMAGPTFDGLRAIPSVALMPLGLLLFGWGLSMEVSVVAYACCWPILIATWSAVRGVEPRLLEVADALEMPFAERLWKIVLPAAFARINVGLRIALGVALVVAVTIEIAVNPRGLGYSLVLAQQSLRPDLMFAQILWLALIGFLLNALMRTVEGPRDIERRAA